MEDDMAYAGNDGKDRRMDEVLSGQERYDWMYEETDSGIPWLMNREDTRNIHF